MSFSEERYEDKKSLKGVHRWKKPNNNGNKLALMRGPKMRVEVILHECIRRSIVKHGPKKRWRSFPWVSSFVSKFNEFHADDEKLQDPSTDSDMAMAGSLIGLNTVYKFRLVHVATVISSTGAGVISSYHNADPSGGVGSTWTSAEWAALITLFSEVKMDSFSVHFSGYKSNTQLLNNRIVISGVLSSVSAIPTTYDTVWDNADAVVYCLNTETSLHGYTHTIKGTDLSWAIVTTPNPGSYAGVPGSIQFYGTAFTVTLPYLNTDLSGVYSFRSRI